MFGNLLQSFVTQVVIIKSHNIPKKMYNISEISTMLLLNYRTKITQDNKSRAGLTENRKDKKIEGIYNADKRAFTTK